MVPRLITIAVSTSAWTSGSVTAVAVTDPLVQALVLTAIVISLGTTAFALVLTYRIYEEHGTIDLFELGRRDEGDGGNEGGTEDFARSVADGGERCTADDSENETRTTSENESGRSEASVGG